MPDDPSLAEDKRSVERFRRNWQARAMLSGDNDLPCVVEDVSMVGARLRFLEAPPGEERFTVRIPTSGFVGICKPVRRIGGTGIAVMFEPPMLSCDPAALPADLVAPAQPAQLRCPVHQLWLTLDGIREFRICGFAASLEVGDAQVVIYRGATLRGAWVRRPAGLHWQSASARSELVAETPADAARATMMMVLKTMQLTRALVLEGQRSRGRRAPWSRMDHLAQAARSALSAVRHA